MVLVSSGLSPAAGSPSLFWSPLPQTATASSDSQSLTSILAARADDIQSEPLGPNTNSVSSESVTAKQADQGQTLTISSSQECREQMAEKDAVKSTEEWLAIIAEVCSS